ncbi:GatB/YqeY domain-containing protein [Leekyejoonella antrihumi]|uniref:GatB/YqeY domain-containing protein n=1 Tax=Leekyejoonella antrihumi TaxID=1660198 RepID=A0A563DWN1_9MICO|nr:GatB/YqeY domain-containing protein [Leekyejoonella antrihumi]TWP34333.1 GatB/YqeY domain-containing protein [Leekyejoonella antrihumi]
MSRMTLKQTLKSDLTSAMKARDKVRTGTLRMTLSAVTNAEVAGAEVRELSDDEVLKVVIKEAKKRREAATAYDDANRAELAEQERAELEVLEAYLPSQLSDEELDALAKDAVAETGATGMAGMGQVMKVVQPKIAGRAEGGRVAAAVKRALAG